jgi:hypothetical protein
MDRIPEDKVLHCALTAARGQLERLQEWLSETLDRVKRAGEELGRVAEAYARYCRENEDEDRSPCWDCAGPQNLSICKHCSLPDDKRINWTKGI